MPKLTKEIEDKIFELIEQGGKNAEISRKLGIHRTTVANQRKEYENRKREEEEPETMQEVEKNARAQEKEPGKAAPADPLSTPTQVSELEKRMSELEKKQRKATKFVTDLMTKALLRLDKSEEIKRQHYDNRITPLEKMKNEILHSFSERLDGDYICKHIGENGYCHYYGYDESAVKKEEYLHPNGRSLKGGSSSTLLM